MIGAWLRRYAQVFPMYGKTLEQLPDRFDAFEAALSDLTPQELERGFRECLKTCREFPTPADVLGQIKATEKARDDFESEKAWANVQQILGRHWYGELMPVMSSKKPENWGGRVQEHNGGSLLWPAPFDAATDYAIRIAGGLDRIAKANGDRELDFIRRDFLANHKRHKETAGLLAPSREEAKAFLDQLKEPNQLGPVN